MHRSRIAPSMGAAAGALAAIGLAGALVPLREHVANTSVALLLVLPVLLGAVIGGWVGGAVAAVFSTLAFDFFHTEPYGSLTIGSADDVETALILLAVGLIVGLVAARGGRALVEAREGRSDVRRIHRVAELVADGAPSARVIAAATEELQDMLPVGACEFEGPPTGTPLPRLDRSGAIGSLSTRYSGHGFSLPSEGIEIGVVGRGRERGRLVLRPVTSADGVSLEERIVAVAIADQIGAAIAAEHRDEENPNREEPTR